MKDHHTLREHSYTTPVCFCFHTSKAKLTIINHFNKINARRNFKKDEHCVMSFCGDPQNSCGGLWSFVC